MSFSDAFQLLAAKRLKLPVSGKQYAEVGDDVTEYYKDNKWLSSLVDMGELVIVPRGSTNVALNVTGSANPNNVVSQSAAGVTGEKISATGSVPVAEAPAPVVEEAVAEPAPEPESDVEAIEEVAEVASEITDPADHSAGDVIAYAEANPESAGNLLDMELNGKARKSVVSALTDLVQSEGS